MIGERRIPKVLIEKQRAASDPGVSAWVSANAGAGKTHVLAQRVTRLLLAGCDPARILCLTYTKAAAANMANRVFGTLAEWTTLDDAALDARIAAIGHARPDTRLHARARRLFAVALDTPGGLKVQTIHAFCTRVLHQFPFEADVAAQFGVLEERAEAEMLERLRTAVFLDAAADPEGAIGRAIATIIAHSTETTFAEAVEEALLRRDEMSAWFDVERDNDPAVLLSRALGLDPDDTLELAEAEIVNSPLMPPQQWSALAEALRADPNAKNDCKQARVLEEAAREIGPAQVESYLSVFFTAEGDPRKQVCSQAMDTREPGLAALVRREQQRLVPLRERRLALIARTRSAALHTIVHAVLQRYSTEKQRRGLLDYEDLIDRTLALFDRASAAWVLYKLDLGIDHLLVDEAQDTSPKQWEIVRRLVSEFTAGEGARAKRRTIFAVGDEKQSIFSFRGAAPQQFAEMRRAFAKGFGAIDAPWRDDLRFEQSFRSVPLVLAAVDRVFSRSQAYAGLTADPAPTVHTAIREDAPGRVELWPIVKAEPTRADEGWERPFQPAAQVSHTVRLARKIARRVGSWVAAGYRPGEVLILVRQRGPLFEAIIRALKDGGVRVAGADRLVLTEHIAVMDLLALADALLLAEDDLALAAVIKSPLFGLTEEQLFGIAHGRGAVSLRASLAKAAEKDLAFASVHARLDRMAESVRMDGPFAFYSRVLGAEGGRAHFLARLGRESDDVLDEFLAHALDFEMREIPTVQAFASWLRAGHTEVKRDMDIARDEVRVMTVHGAKGLEAPIVVLADTTTRPAGPRPPRLLAVPVTPDATPGRRAVVWAGAKVTDTTPLSAARQAAEKATCDEHARLLYVALTRAADQLVVCGLEGVNKRPDGCWWDLVHDALADELASEPAPDGEGEIWCWRKQAVAPQALGGGGDQEPETPATPRWLREPAPVDRGRPVVLRPSAALVRGPKRASAGGGTILARERGRIVHRLLQSIPDVAPERRAAVAQDFLGRNAPNIPADERNAILSKVLATLNDPALSALFTPGSRAEVPVGGGLRGGSGQEFLVSGQLDRLAVTPEAVLIADYKTDAPAPRSSDDVPESYVAQLALYRAVLQPLYPGRDVRAVLVWTAGPSAQLVPAAQLDSALDDLLTRSV